MASTDNPTQTATQTTVVQTGGGFWSGLKEGSGCCCGVVIVIIVIILILLILSGNR